MPSTSLAGPVLYAASSRSVPLCLGGPAAFFACKLVAQALLPPLSTQYCYGDME